MTQTLSREQVLVMEPVEIDRYIHTNLFDGEDLTEFKYKHVTYTIPDRRVFVKETDTGVTWRECLAYSLEISSAWEVEEKIKELRLQAKYCIALKQVVIGTGEYVGMFDYIHATPEQRCKAALLAVLDI
ncbi:hypothetical protein IFU39_00365 [Paenibacillus sp. CFBP 13594]|uniref:BC1872 family protein n=1 Tax=Paenibacillus sp. CFBP 13594 TaxID=2774037 RepID=UPI0017849EAE|nr:hypothetical protein [Paenibacillus sp. CFBP 13594]MBD8836272.1 hypothetical protein [Paenibacillus sp. CFBP 13594]